MCRGEQERSWGCVCRGWMNRGHSRTWPSHGIAVPEKPSLTMLIPLVVVLFPPLPLVEPAGRTAEDTYIYIFEIKPQIKLWLIKFQYSYQCLFHGLCDAIVTLLHTKLQIIAITIFTFLHDDFTAFVKTIKWLVWCYILYILRDVFVSMEDLSFRCIKCESNKFFFYHFMHWKDKSSTPNDKINTCKNVVYGGNTLFYLLSAVEWVSLHCSVASSTSRATARRLDQRPEHGIEGDGFITNYLSLL